MNIPADTVQLSDYERHFRARVDLAIHGYIAGAAADGITQRENRSAFDRVKTMPRALADISSATACTTLLGETLGCPILIAPLAQHRLVVQDGELSTSRPASLARTWMTVSTQASVRPSRILEAAPQHAPPDAS